MRARGGCVQIVYSIESSTDKLELLSQISLIRLVVVVYYKCYRGRRHLESGCGTHLCKIGLRFHIRIIIKKDESDFAAVGRYCIQVKLC